MCFSECTHFVFNGNSRILCSLMKKIIGDEKSFFKVMHIFCIFHNNCKLIRFDLDCFDMFWIIDVNPNVCKPQFYNLNTTIQSWIKQFAHTKDFGDFYYIVVERSEWNCIWKNYSVWQWILNESCVLPNVFFVGFDMLIN